MAEAWPLVIVVAGAAATYLWRALGVAMSGRLKADSPIVDLVGYIAFGLLAGLISRMILLPIGPLQSTDLWVRLSAAAFAAVVFFALRRNLLAGVLAGGGAMALLASLVAG